MISVADAAGFETGPQSKFYLCPGEAKWHY